MRRLLPHALLLLLALSAFAGCGRSSGGQSLARFVPADSYGVLSVNWARVRGDRELRAVVKASDIEQLFGVVGVAAAEVGELAIFSDMQNSGSGLSGIVLRGSYKAQDVIAGLGARGWTADDFGGTKIYSDPRGETHLARLKGSLLVAGTRAGVEGSLRAADDADASFVSNESYRKLSSSFRNEQAPVSLVVAFPQTMQDVAEAAVQLSATALDLGGVGPLGDLLSKIGYARALGCSISRDGPAFPVRVVAVMKDEGSASLVSGTLNLFKSVTSLAPQGNLSGADADALNSLRSMKIDRQRDVLSIRMSLTQRDIMPPAARR